MIGRSASGAPAFAARLAVSLLLLVGLTGLQQPPRIGPNGDGTLTRLDDRQWLLLQSASVVADTARGEYRARFGPALARVDGQPFRLSGYMLLVEASARTVNLSAQQTFPLGKYNVVAEGDTQYRTSRYVGFFYLPTQLLPEVWRTNAQLSFGPSDDRWSIAGFVRNIENQRTIIFSSTTPLANAMIAGTTAPRTYGVRGSFKF